MCKRKRKATRRVNEEREETSCGDSETEEEVNRIDRYRGWPETSTKAKCRCVRHIATEHFEGNRHRKREEGYKEPVFKDKVGKGAGRQVQVQDDGEGRDTYDETAAGAERHHRPGTSVRGRAERGHDIVVANFEGEGTGCAQRGHDIVVGINVKSAGGGRSVQGHDSVVEKNVKGAGGKYQNLEGTRNQGQV